MKSLIKMTLISSAIVLALAGCDEKKATENSSTATTTNSATTSNTKTENSNTPKDNSNTPTDNKVTLSTDAQKEAYALGSSFATYMKSNLEQNQISPDTEYVMKGFNDTYQGKSQMKEDEVKSILEAFGKRIQEENRVRFEKEKAENTEAGDKFRTEFAKQDGVKQTKSGLLYQILKEGNGPHPTDEDIVIVHYVGTLTDGRIFDSSYDRGETAKFPLGSVIGGWKEGIQLIGVGGKIKLVVPPNLGYGNQNIPGQDGKADIQPASTLVFEVELLGIDNKDQQKSQPEEKAGQ
ncbi:hypothetical protein A9G11_12385 [Gilliamella sp. wkB108]|uniref:FKBP-type peptidyl-prolyl cis-trans isomerase n=1 Tax=Gilliamella sp. wkB108 TaxID=3120256 RepID=UPI00080E096C|nr:FKBP-type peptidyl-prolyl cis-trans isomerase [Gilliamella apicola]OCG27887.1 hypothetical protein A9G11_12385 [Gilliamella apicola]